MEEFGEHQSPDSRNPLSAGYRFQLGLGCTRRSQTCRNPLSAGYRFQQKTFELKEYVKYCRNPLSAGLDGIRNEETTRRRNVDEKKKQKRAFSVPLTLFVSPFLRFYVSNLQKFPYQRGIDFNNDHKSSQKKALLSQSPISEIR